MANKNARVIIPLVLVTWVVAIFVFRTGTPVWMEVAFVGAFAVGVPLLVFYLMAEQGWSKLAKHYRRRTPFTGTWQPCGTAQMSLVSVDHPDFNQQRLRLISTLRVGTTPEALYLSMLFSKIPVLGWFFPALEIPWSEVQSARPYEAPGWVKPLSEPGALLQLSYDPNYTGTLRRDGGRQPTRLHPAATQAILGDGAATLGLPAIANPG